MFLKSGHIEVLVVVTSEHVESRNTENAILGPHSSVPAHFMVGDARS
jgi:hypothetical protein